MMFRFKEQLRDPEPAPAGGGVDGLPPPAPTDDAVDQLTRTIEEQGRTLQQLQSRIPPAPPPAQPVAPDKKAIEKQFWENPLDMVAAISQHAVQSALAAQPQVGQDTLVETAKQQVRSLDPDVWDKFYLEIEAKVSEAVQPQYRGSVNVWRNAFNLVKGEHVSDIIKMKAGPPKPAVPGDGPAPPSPRSAPAPKEDPLTAEQKEVAAKFGMSEDDYRRGLANVANQPGKTLPCAWDQVITFDSEAKRKEQRRAATK